VKRVIREFWKERKKKFDLKKKGVTKKKKK